MKRRRTISLRDETYVTCPYCHESQLLVLDPDSVGELVHDCDVCCRPWRVRVARDANGELEVDVDRAQ
jgi:hypothetical protein